MDGEGSTLGWSGSSGVVGNGGHQGTQPASGIAPPGSREVVLLKGGVCLHAEASEGDLAGGTAPCLKNEPV